MFVDPTIETVSTRLEHEVTLLCQKAELIGASIGIVRQGELAWTHNYGYKDLDSGEVPGSDTLFRIGSITKTFTGTAIFKLRDLGLLELDDPLLKHIPEFTGAIPLKGDLEDVTLRRMMCHHSGLMSYAPTGEAYFSTGNTPSMSEILDAVPNIEVSIEPDSAFKYSNLAFGLLGEVIARVSGRSYEEFISDEMLQPLGMNSTTFEPTGELKIRTATGYQFTAFEEAPVAAGYPSIGGQTAAGQMYSTVEDLARWVDFHLSIRGETDTDKDSGILSVRSLKEMQRPVFLNDDWSTGYGLPWVIQREGDSISRWHNGAIDGFGSIISFVPETGTGVIGLFNRTGGTPGMSSKIFEILREAKDANNAVEPKKKPSATPPELREYLGFYQGAFGNLIKIEYRDGSLQAAILIRDQSVPPTVLLPTKERDVVRAKNGRLAGDRVVFGRSADGSVSSVAAEAGLYKRLSENPDQAG